MHVLLDSDFISEIVGDGGGGIGLLTGVELCRPIIVSHAATGVHGTIVSRVRGRTNYCK